MNTPQTKVVPPFDPTKTKKSIKTEGQLVKTRRKRIAQDIAAGMAVVDAASLYGVSVTEVYRACHLHAVYPNRILGRSAGPAPPKQYEIIALLVRGASVGLICRELLVSKQYVYDVRRAANLTGVPGVPPTQEDAKINPHLLRSPTLRAARAIELKAAPLEVPPELQPPPIKETE